MLSYLNSVHFDKSQCVISINKGRCKQKKITPQTGIRQRGYSLIRFSLHSCSVADNKSINGIMLFYRSLTSQWLAAIIVIVAYNLGGKPRWAAWVQSDININVCQKELCDWTALLSTIFCFWVTSHFVSKLYVASDLDFRPKIFVVTSTWLGKHFLNQISTFYDFLFLNLQVILCFCLAWFPDLNFRLLI